MRLLSKMALVALLALGLMNVSHAQGLVNPLLPVRGTKEVAVAGNFQFEPNDNFQITARYGPFLDDARIQVGGEVAYFGGDGNDVYSLGAFANYHFPSASQALPYIGLSIGVTDGDDVDSSVTYGAQGGVKYFINSSVAGFGELVYRAADGADDDFRVQFGLAIYLR